MEHATIPSVYLLHVSFADPTIGHIREYSIAHRAGKETRGFAPQVSVAGAAQCVLPRCWATCASRARQHWRFRTWHHGPARSPRIRVDVGAVDTQRVPLSRAAADGAVHSMAIKQDEIGNAS